MRTTNVIRLKSAENGVEVGRHRYTRDLAHALGDDGRRGIATDPPTSSSATGFGAAGRALMSAVDRAGLARGSRPQEGAAYG